MNHRISVIVAISLALAVAGCSTTHVGEPETSTSAPTKIDSTENDSSSSQKPETKTSSSFIPASANGPAKNVEIPKLPTQARKNSEKGAASFAEYYYELVNYTIDTSDASEIKKYTTRQCEVCGNSIIDPADRAKKQGKWQVGGKHHPVVLESHISGKNLAVVTVEYTADAIKSYTEPNKPLSSNPGLDATRVTLGLEYKDGWKVYRIVGAD